MPVTDELLLQLRQIGADDLADAIEKSADSLDKVARSEKDLAKVSQDAEVQDKKRIKGFADLKAGLDLAGNAIGKVTDFVKDSINKFQEYAAQVRDLSRAIGASAEESSALIQVADDVNVSVGTLEAAFKAAIKKGIQPSIDNLAKLSDEYRAIQDPVQRSQFAMEKFGRAGLEMGKLLETGGEAIRGAAKEAKNLGLTLDDKAVKAARDLEIQLDNMNDKVEAFKLKVAQGAVPALNTFFDTLSKGLDVANVMTNGISDMGDAYEMKLTAAIATAVARWGEESEAVKNLSQQLRDYLILRQQIGMTDQEADTRKNIQLAQQQAGTLGLRMAQERLVESGNSELEQIMRNNQAIIDNAAAIDKDKASKEAAAAADAIYRAGINETIAKIDGMAQSLAKATDAQAKQMLAQAALDTIRQAQEKGVISAQDAATATDAVLLKYGLATEKSLAMAKAQQAVNETFLAGKMPLDEYVASSEKLPKIAQDGILSVEELSSVGVKTYDALKKYGTGVLDETTEAIQQETTKVSDSTKKSGQVIYNSMTDAEKMIKNFDAIWRSIPEYRKFTVDVEVTGDKIPTGLPGGARAAGGPVTAGIPYMVGERGPEMFVPSQNGSIVSNQNVYNTAYNVTTDRTGLAYMFERQRQAEQRM